MELALKLYINKAPSEKKKKCLSIVWNKLYQTYITLRATWMEKYPCMLLCCVGVLLPSQAVSLVKAEENHLGSWI